MGSHLTINELVGNRQEREVVEKELARLIARRDELIAEARLARVPISEIGAAAGMRLG